MTDLVEAQAAYRRLVLFDLPTEHRIALNLAFYRTFAIPGIAELLVRTGQMQQDPMKRSLDTGLYIYEMVYAGFDDERARYSMRAVNRMHRRWPIAMDDYRYVLTTFIVVPARWVDTFGPRTLTTREREATTVFYREMGRRMNIDGLPESFADAERILDTYEAAHLRYSDAGRDLMAATQPALARALPHPLRRCTALITRLLLDDQVALAVGMRPAPQWLRRPVCAVARRRRSRPAEHSWFHPGALMAGVYDHGYALEDLGVEHGDARR